MRIYQRNDSGEAVRDIQTRLGALGFPPSADPEGDYGKATEEAVKAFQQSRGLAVDGLVGPETWRTLVEAGYGLGDRLVYHRRPMLRGDDVAELQRRLNSLGFDCGKPDGIFGPDTLRGLLEFQRNRRMAEDGICGSAVIGELDLMARATSKHGRDEVRERQWLRGLPPTIAGQRFMLDPWCRDEVEATISWRAAVAVAARLRDRGAISVLSRSEDTRPDERVRARRANRLGVDVLLSLALPGTEQPACFYFSSEHSHSEAGRRLAGQIGEHLGLDVLGRSYPILRETRPPAVVVCSADLNEAVGGEIALAVEEVFAAAEP